MSVINDLIPKENDQIKLIGHAFEDQLLTDFVILLILSIYKIINYSHYLIKPLIAYTIYIIDAKRC